MIHSLLLVVALLLSPAFAEVPTADWSQAVGQELLLTNPQGKQILGTVTSVSDGRVYITLASNGAQVDVGLAEVTALNTPDGGPFPPEPLLLGEIVDLPEGSDPVYVTVDGELVTPDGEPASLPLESQEPEPVEILTEGGGEAAYTQGYLAGEVAAKGRSLAKPVALGFCITGGVTCAACAVPVGVPVWAIGTACVSPFIAAGGSTYAAIATTGDPDLPGNQDPDYVRGYMEGYRKAGRLRRGVAAGSGAAGGLLAGAIAGTVVAAVVWGGGFSTVQ